MKTYLKITAGVVSIAIVCLGYSYIRFLQDEDASCDTITIDGLIGHETFVNLRGCLSRSYASKKTFVVKSSAGGDNFAALALGILIHRYNWDVEVVDYCASACAIFILPAGKTKYLHRNSVLLFHGGPYQESLMEMAKKFVPTPMNAPPPEPVTLGQVNKENTFSTAATRSAAYKEVHEFLSIPEVSTPVDILLALRRKSDQLYQELGVNPLLGTYGQTGGYESTYKSYKYVGFVYGLDSLRRFGIGNIELKDGEWHPEKNPAYKEVYEVTYP